MPEIPLRQEIVHQLVREIVHNAPNRMALVENMSRAFNERELVYGMANLAVKLSPEELRAVLERLNRIRWGVEVVVNEALQSIPLVPGELVSSQDYTIDDYIKLKVRPGLDPELTRTRQRLLDRFGLWWKVKSAIGTKAWHLTSLDKQPREVKKILEVQNIGRPHDLQYAVIGVLKFPAAFDYDFAEQGWRVNHQPHQQES